MKTPVRILAFDPGFGTTGWATMEAAFKKDTTEILITNIGEFGITRRVGLAKYRDDRTVFGKRSIEIKLLQLQLTELINEHSPDYIVHEAAFVMPGRMTAFISLYSWVLALKLLCHNEYKLPVYEIAPRLVKRLFAGSGNANKDEMAEAFKRNKNLVFCKTCDLGALGEHAKDACAVGFVFITSADFLPKLLK